MTQTLREFVRARREQLQLTQTDIETRFGVPQSYQSDVERGRIVRPSPEFRARLAGALNVNPVDLLLIGGEITTADLQGWIREQGYRRLDEDSWVQELAAELSREEPDSPRARLAQMIPWLLQSEAIFISGVIQLLETSAERKELEDQSDDLRSWRNEQDVLQALRS